MGQDTYAGIGVATEIKLTFENLPRIIKILEKIWCKSFDLIVDCYCHSSDCEDEKENFGDKMCDFINEKDELKEEHEDSYYHDELNYLKNIQNDEEFETFLEEIELNEGSPLHFMIDTVSAYTRNISRRRCPSIFDFNELSVSDVIEKFSRAKNIFIDLEFSDEQIKVGYVIHDSY